MKAKSDDNKSEDNSDIEIDNQDKGIFFGNIFFISSIASLCNCIFFKFLQKDFYLGLLYIIINKLSYDTAMVAGANLFLK